MCTRELGHADDALRKIELVERDTKAMPTKRAQNANAMSVSQNDRLWNVSLSPENACNRCRGALLAADGATVAQCLLCYA